MEQWLRKNVWWIGLVMMFVIALFSNIFTFVGNFLVKYLPVYWLPGSIALIIVLLGMILKRLDGKSDHTP